MRRKAHGNTPLRILQVNVGRGYEAHNVALQLASVNEVDILLLQEPWVLPDLAARRTITLPGFNTLAPCITWRSRPRVLTYVRKTRGLQPYQRAVDLSPDLLQINVALGHGRRMAIWNIYNAPQGAIAAGGGLDALFQEQGSPQFIGGDFNLRHPDWDPVVERPYPRAEELSMWAQSKALTLLNPVGTATHDRGGTLDLAFCSIDGAVCEVSTDLRTPSDHESLLVTIPCQLTRGEDGRIRYATIDHDIFARTLGGTQTLRTLEDHGAVETEAATIASIIQTAVGASSRRSLANSRGTVWWNEKCTLARTAYRRARRMGPAEDEKHALRKAVQHARRDYWRSRVEGADNLPKVYKIVNWHKATMTYQSPPLQDSEGHAVQEPQAKARLLHSALLSRHLDAEDIPDHLNDPSPIRTIEWHQITEREAYAATCQVTSTSPGADEITASVLRMAWPTLGQRITNLFRQCLSLGIHPRAFKQADVVMLPKSGRRDRTIPKSYRPIALLSCLGKGLERLLARRLAYWALKLEILARDQCSAISHRSATDLTTALLCDVREAQDKGQVAGMVTVDVKGAFDGVLRNRLCRRLREQGWPINVVSWVQSFFRDRSARIRLDGHTSTAFPVVCGLPQGSPVSPILFLLYVEPFLRLSRGRFGYADDGSLLATARTVPEVNRILQIHVDRTLDWGRDNGILFDSAKTELQYFHNKRKYHEPSIRAGDAEIKPNDCTRWLGVFFDRKLNFKDHVRRACQRARVVTDHVRHLGNTRRGLNPSLTRQAVQGSVFATLFYGAETWYGPLTPKWAITQVQSAINRAGRATLPVYKTTPTAALLRETGWGPASAWLTRIHDRLASRVAAADPKHPLRRRWNTSLFQWIRRRQDLERSADTTTPPWLSYRHQAKEAVGAVGRDRGLEEFRRWTSSRHDRDLTVYSDGSMNDEGLSGAAFCVYQGPNLLTEGTIPLGRTAEVYDAEVIGANEGLRAALQLPQALEAPNVTVCLDNEESAIRLHAGIPTASSSKQIREFCETAHQARMAAANIRKVTVRWVPGHQGIPGNERADLLAKAACSLQPPVRTQATVARARRLLDERYESDIRQYWQSNAPKRYKELGIEMTSQLPREMRALSRRNLGLLIAARTGHGDFAEYHRRFHHEDAVLRCECGDEKTPEHLFQCVRLRHRIAGPGRGEGKIKWALGTIEGALAVGKWATKVL